MNASALPSLAMLCVDDEAIILLALERTLRNSFGGSYRYERALGGSQAIATIEELENDGVDVAVIISDWRMPGMSGDQFLRIAHDRCPRARCFLLTGYAESAQVEALKVDVGLAAAFSKPCDGKALAAAIRTSLESS